MTPFDALPEFFQRYGSMMVALTTLVFTVATFWWNNWRRGKLICGPPRTYAAHENPERQVLSIPVLITNTGPRTVAVTALRLVGPNTVVFDHHLVRPAIRLQNRQNEIDFATNFAVKGRDVDSAVREFRHEGPGWSFEAGSHSFQLQALQDESTDWTTISRFTLIVTEDAANKIPSKYLTYENTGALPPASRVENAIGANDANPGHR